MIDDHFRIFKSSNKLSKFEKFRTFVAVEHFLQVTLFSDSCLESKLQMHVCRCCGMTHTLHTTVLMILKRGISNVDINLQCLLFSIRLTSYTLLVSLPQMSLLAIKVVQNFLRTFRFFFLFEAVCDKFFLNQCFKVKNF